MDANTFDNLVARIFSRPSRRDTVKGVLAGALVSAGLPALAEAKGHEGKGKRHAHKGNGKDHNTRKDHQAQAHDEGKPGKTTGQVRAEGKKPFCLCPGTNPATCTATTCVNCVSQGEIGKNKRKQIKKANPFSFVGECPAPPTTTTTTTTSTTTTTTTTRIVCGGACDVGTNTCGQAGSTCVCRGTSVIPGTPGTCTAQAATCSGQLCISGAPNQCAELGGSCFCLASAASGALGTCGIPATTTTTTPAP